MPEKMREVLRQPSPNTNSLESHRINPTLLSVHPSHHELPPRRMQRTLTSPRTQGSKQASSRRQRRNSKDDQPKEPYIHQNPLLPAMPRRQWKRERKKERSAIVRTSPSDADIQHREPAPRSGLQRIQVFLLLQCMLVMTPPHSKKFIKSKLSAKYLTNSNMFQEALLISNFARNSKRTSSM